MKLMTLDYCHKQSWLIVDSAIYNKAKFKLNTQYVEENLIDKIEICCLSFPSSEFNHLSINVSLMLTVAKNWMI